MDFKRKRRLAILSLLGNLYNKKVYNIFLFACSKYMDWLCAKISKSYTCEHQTQKKGKHFSAHSKGH